MTTNTYAGVDYSLWNAFEQVENNILKNITLLHIFGYEGQSALFVTNDDQVYGVGINLVGSLGVGDTGRTDIPIKLDILCGKYVIGFATGSVHSLALSKEGELYSWGDNNLGKLGNGTILSRDNPGRVILPEGVKVIQVACSDRYTTAITSDFRVLHWGDIEWSCGSSQTLPVFLHFLEDVQICNISCGALHAAALSTNGKVFTWGCNDTGQLGLGPAVTVKITPHLIQGLLDGKEVQQIACSMAATTVLTKDGFVYAWGQNSGGVLGLEFEIETVHYPQRVNLTEPVKSIAAANMGYIITAIAEDCIYKWGVTDKYNVGPTRFPYVVNVKHLLNAYSCSPIPRCIRIENIESVNQIEGKENGNMMQEDQEEVVRDIGSKLYNQEEYSDLILRLSDGVVYVHKLILRAFCEHFKSMLDGSWIENEKKEIDLTSYNPQAYRAFVKYIYTGKVESGLSGEQLIELYDIAESYFENTLKRRVLSRFPSCLSVENAAELYGAAFSKPCEEIKEICCGFISSCLEAVVLTAGFDNLKGDLCKSMIKRAVQMKVQNEQQAYLCKNEEARPKTN